MPRLRDLAAAALLGAALATPGAAEPARPAAPPLALPGVRRDQPITVTSRTLEFDYKQNVVVYRDDVQAVQGDVHLKSDTLTIWLVSKDQKSAADQKTDGAGDAGTPPAADATLGGRAQLRQVEAAGSVRIDQGERWATGGRAVYDEERRTLVLSEDPVLHDGPNQIAGDRVIVYIDENRSVVEGGEKRVKAVLFPGRDGTSDRRSGTP
jgi:lipopolysaccharide export system protein LptA